MDTILAQVFQLRDAGALFVINHSGGKDSQAMFHIVRALVPAEQILVIHAELPGVEWEGTEEHARATSAGYQFLTVRAGKTFMQMVEQRGHWPSPKYRQCTSDLKRGPIEKAIRHALKERGLKLVVSCMGLRAQESACRSKRAVLDQNKRNSKAGRQWWDWLPIHSMTEREVFQVITDAGQQPHWAYAAGMSRLSCAFCIMSSRADLRTAARLNPDLYQRYVDMERKLGKALLMPSKGEEPRYLPEVTGVQPA